MKPESAPMSTETNKGGRPKLVPEGIRKTVLLDANTIQRAEVLGEGNISLGIRRALSPDLGTSAQAQAPNAEVG